LAFAGASGAFVPQSTGGQDRRQKGVVGGGLEDSAAAYGACYHHSSLLHICAIPHRL